MIGYTTFSFFLLYFGITFVVYSLLPQKVRWVALLLGSVTFYTISAKGHVFMLITVNLIVWLVGLWLQKLSDTQSAKRKAAPKEEKKAIKAKYNGYKRIVLALGAVSVVGILLTGKYTNFFIETFNAVFSQHASMLNIIQPLGLSFFTLQAISYIADIYYGRVQAEKNPLRITLFLSFMLTVVEGPIARYGQLGAQLNTCKINRLEDVSRGFLRVLWGLFKKVFIADRAVLLVTAVFDNYESFSGFGVVAGIVFYTIQLYCEFSGIMDVMCGLGQMMGIEMPENFKRPFFAKSINEFWQRWHITLGAWLRDYIFYGVSFSKGIKNLSSKTRKKFSPYYSNLIPTTVALFFVWFANGFWHGSGWKYIVYGLYYYVLMTIGLFLEPLFAKLSKALRIDRESKGFGVFRVIRTIVIVNFGMLIFRADDLGVALKMFTSIFSNLNPLTLFRGVYDFNTGAGDILLVFIGLAAMVVVGVISEKGINITERIYKLPYVAKLGIYLAFLFVIIIFGAYGEGYGVVDLIYANF